MYFYRLLIFNWVLAYIINHLKTNCIKPNIIYNRISDIFVFEIKK